MTAVSNNPLSRPDLGGFLTTDVGAALIPTDQATPVVAIERPLRTAAALTASPGVRLPAPTGKSGVDVTKPEGAEAFSKGERHRTAGFVSTIFRGVTASLTSDGSSVKVTFAGEARTSPGFEEI